MPKEKTPTSKAVVLAEDPEYLAKRAKNNEAIKKSREKARIKASETKEKVDTLKTDNKRLEDKIEVLGQEMKFLKDIFIAHASGSAPAASATSGAEAGPPPPQVAPSELPVKNEDEALFDLLSELDPGHGAP